MQKLPVAGDIVRVVTSIGTGKPRGLYAYVLSVSPIMPELVGASGEPTISLALLDNPSVAALGKVDWHNQLQRFVGVHHWSHPNAIKGLVSLSWVDALPSAEGIIYKSPLPTVLFQSQVPDAFAGSPMPADPANVVPIRTDIPAAAADPAPAFTKVAVACLGDGQPLDPAGEVDLLVDGQRVPTTLGQLKEGDVLAEFDATVIETVVDSGVLYVSTEPVNTQQAEQAPSAADLDAKAAEEAARANTGGPPLGTGSSEPIQSQGTPQQ